MPFNTSTNMVLGYGNKLTFDKVASITLGAGFLDTAGHRVSNLLYPDPSLSLITTTPTQHPTIIIGFTASTSIACMGLINHNLYDYDSIKLDTGLSISGPWVQVNTGSFGASPTWSPNCLLLVTPTPTFWFRITIIKASAWYAFRLGSLFLGSVAYEVPKNPIADGGTVRLVNQIVPTRRAIGGALHRTRGVRTRSERMELLFDRITKTDMWKLSDVMNQTENITTDDTVGIISADQAGTAMPSDGTAHFFGSIEETSIVPAQGNDPAGHRYNVGMSLAGVE